MKAPRGKGLESYVHRSSFENLDVIPASPSLGALEHALESKHKIYKLRDSIQALSARYDRILLIHRQHLTFYLISINFSRPCIDSI